MLEAEADAEYQSGIEELEGLVARGIPLDEIWRVAKGEVPLADFKADKRLVTKQPKVEISKPTVVETSVQEAPAQEAVIEETQDSVVGNSIASTERNYLDLIKVCMLIEVPFPPNILSV